MSMFEDIPVDVGIIYEGERIRGRDMRIELGGPREEYKFELVLAREMDEIEDGKITIIGPDISDFPERTNTPFGIIIEVAGADVEKDLEGVIERRLHEYCNFIEGFMHLNQRYKVLRERFQQLHPHGRGPEAAIQERDVLHREDPDHIHH